jgi:hypothetical protein
MKLDGKPGDSLEKRLSSLSTGGTDVDASARVQAKLLECYEKCMDPKSYKMEDGALTDALTGKNLKTKAAVLTLDDESFLKFVDAAYARLKDDEAFFKDLETAMENQGAGATDAKTQVEDAIDDVRDYLEDEDLSLTARVHYVGSTPVAVEIVFDLTGDKGINLTALLQKNAQKDSVGYILKLDAQSETGSTSYQADAKLTIQKTSKGYAIDGNIGIGAGSESVTVTLDGATEIEKASSVKYNIDSEFTCQWSAAGSEDGSLTFKLNEEVLFGSAVEPLEDDKDYLYEKLSKNAKEVEKIEDFYSALFGGLVPAIQ